MLDLSNHTDRELWNRVRLNDKQAFEELYNRHWKSLFISAHALISDHEAARDIIQEVFTELWVKRRSTFIDSFSAYLKSTVRNKVFKQLRHGKVAQKHLDTLDKIAYADATEEMVNLNIARAQYEEALRQLPEKCREVFVLKREENLSTKAVAKKLGISVKTVENQMTKAVKHLRKSLKNLSVMLLIFFTV